MKAMFFVLLLIINQAYALAADHPALKQGREILEAVMPGELQNHDFHGFEIQDDDHPLAAMSFNLETRKIQIYRKGLSLSPPLFASSLFHELRHAEIDHHDSCLSGPLKGIEACDDRLPALEEWKSGGSYVYELYFQKRAIEMKIPGYEKLIQQFIGNLHIRFINKPEISLIDEWIGPELLELKNDFIANVRKNFY